MENIKQKRLLITFIVILAILNIAVLSTFWISSRHHAPRHGHHKKGHHDRGLKKLTETLDLSDEQQSIFKKLRNAHFEKMDSIHIHLKNNKDAFFEEMTHQNLQDSVVLVRIEMATIASGEIDKALFEHYKKLMKNCNEEQKEILRNMFSEMVKQKGQRGK